MKKFNIWKTFAMLHPLRDIFFILYWSEMDEANRWNEKNHNEIFYMKHNIHKCLKNGNFFFIILFDMLKILRGENWKFSTLLIENLSEALMLR
jgi:hypothetical protein